MASEMIDTPDLVVTPGQLTFTPFALPGFSGDIAAALPTAAVPTAPQVAYLRLGAGATLAKHYHPKFGEVVYVVEGTMINDGVSLPAGSFLTHGAGVVHGPHTTETGCLLLFVQPYTAGPEDSIFTD